MTIENGERRTRIRSHKDLEVYQRAMAAVMTLFELSKSFPKEETYALTDQVRRCTRSVCANIGEAWRKRRYPAAFITKISDAVGEAGESQVWIEFAVKCGYLSRQDGARLFREYHAIIATLVGMINHSDKWTFPVHPTKHTRESH